MKLAAVCLLDTWAEGEKDKKEMLGRQASSNRSRAYVYRRRESLPRNPKTQTHFFYTKRAFAPGSHVNHPTPILSMTRLLSLSCCSPGHMGQRCTQQRRLAAAGSCMHEAHHVQARQEAHRGTPR